VKVRGVPVRGLPTPDTGDVVVGSGGPNTKLRARILGLSGGSIPFRGVEGGIEVVLCLGNGC
jgi:hypothetical protein